jgi:hypothetical protein
VAKLNICDLCKKPGETAHRLSLFKKDGKKHLDKKDAEICEGCDKRLRDAIDAAATAQTTPAFIPTTFGPTSPAGIHGYVVDKPAAPKIQPQAEDKGDGVFKVKPALTREEVKAKNKAAEASPKKEGCPHKEMTMDDTSMKVVCKGCGIAMEDA